MNILFLSLVYHPEAIQSVWKSSRTGLQNQANRFQWAVVSGLKQNMWGKETLDVLNVLPVGVFPKYYRKLFLSKKQMDAHFFEIGSINLPWLKQHIRRMKAVHAITAWTEASVMNRTVLLYSLYLPFMQAVQKVKRAFPDLHTAIIVSDLPNNFGISSGRKGVFRKLEFLIGKKKLDLCPVFDGFILLSRHMADILPLTGKKQMVMEGLIIPEAISADTLDKQGFEEHPQFPVVLYAGTLNRDLGIDALLSAFSEPQNCVLWLCGKGDMENDVRRAASNCVNIHYFGFVSQKKSLSLQKQADILINPRSCKNTFTCYSFPSKTLEYMSSGKPVLCYRLEGIPKEYDAFLSYIDQEGPEGIRNAIRILLSRPKEEREKMGEEARNFVLSHKNAKVQCRKLISLLRRL